MMVKVMDLPRYGNETGGRQCAVCLACRDVFIVLATGHNIMLLCASGEPHRPARRRAAVGEVLTTTGRKDAVLIQRTDGWKQ